MPYMALLPQEFVRYEAVPRYWPVEGLTRMMAEGLLVMYWLE